MVPDPLLANSDTEKILSLLELSNDRRVYSLLDAAQYPQFSRKTIPSLKKGRLFSLLGETAQADAAFAGPLLLAHDNGDARNANWVVGELQHRPFASLISSSQPLPALKAHLGWLTDVEHEDGTEWVMRYYDPRILPFWLDVLSPEQRALALSGIHRWAYIDVRGRWQVIHGDDAPLSPSPEKPMLLSSEQHERLMDKCMPFLFIDMLTDDDPTQLEDISPHARYDFFAAQLSKARKYRLESVADLKTYCLLALMCGLDFDQHPVAGHALEYVGTDPTFSDRIQSLGSSEWAELLKWKPEETT